MRRSSLLLTSLTLIAACGEQPLAPESSLVPGTPVGPEGGLVTSVDGRARLDIPAGALEDTVEIALAPAPDERGVFIPGTSYELSPSGLVFARPVRLSLAIDPSIVRTASGTLTIAKLRDDGVLVAQSTVDDPSTTTATATLGGFSHYGMQLTNSLPSPIVRLRASHIPGVTTLGFEVEHPERGDGLLLERAGPFLEPPRESDWQRLAELPMSSGGYADVQSFTPEAIYWYRIRCITDGAMGPPATIFVGTFVDRAPRPLGLAARVSGRDVHLRWDLFAIPGVDAFHLDTIVDGRSTRDVIPNTFDALTKWSRGRGRRHTFLLSAVRDGVAVASESVSVAIDGFRLSVGASAVRGSGGGAASTSVTVDFVGTASPVVLSVRPFAGALRGVMPLFGLNPITAGDTPLTLVLAATVAPGRHHLLVEGRTADQTESISLVLDVQEPHAYFDLEMTPNPLVIRAGETVKDYAIGVRLLGGCYSPIAMRFASLPPFLAPLGAVGTRGQLAVTPAAPGRYELVVEGDCAGHKRRHAVAVVVES